MCLAIPAKILAIHDQRAKVDFGGVIREVNVSLVDADVGEYIVVHAGFAIQKLDEKAAQETLSLWHELLNFLEDG